jgi:hypothetical protein
LLSSFCTAKAGEVDAFSLRYQTILDSGVDFDQEVNRRLNTVVEELSDLQCLSKTPTGARPEQKVTVDAANQLINTLNSQFHSKDFFGNYIGKMEVWAKDSLDANKKHQTDLKNSIHADAGEWVLKTFELNPHVSIHGFYVGTDKVGHFFKEGLENYLARRAGEKAALERGIRAWEKGNTGLRTTGVLSYADNNANISGFYFWGHIWRSQNPYFVCDPKANRWKRTERAFTFTDYIHDGWDEGINCSEFTADKKPQIDQRIAALEKKSPGKKFRCPIDENKCGCLKQKYFTKQDQEVLLGPGCRNSQIATKPNCNPTIHPALPGTR